MDGDRRPFPVDRAAKGVQTASVSADHPAPVSAIADALGDTPYALIAVFASPASDFPALIAEMAKAFPDADVIACTTAGEITEKGYDERSIVALGMPAATFATRSLVIEDLAGLEPEALIGQTIRTRAKLQAVAPDFPHEFAFLMVDGLSKREDELVAALSSGLGPVPLFGGSAGDGVRFECTLLAAEGRVHENAAVLTFVRTLCPVKVFSLDHLVPGQTRMVVTKADPANRVVSMINAEPAAAEYSRIVGKDPAQLSPFTFAAHPVVVRLGGRHHVRAIQRVTKDGELEFFSAIDEGLVLTVAEAQDMAHHLEQVLDGLSTTSAPDTIFACDCILRRLEARDRQKTGEISALLRKHRVVGFSTYGEQYGGMHVNQTMTGVAIYPPGSEPGA